jgi:hypothetical protein
MMRSSAVGMGRAERDQQDRQSRSDAGSHTTRRFSALSRFATTSNDTLAPSAKLV